MESSSTLRFFRITCLGGSSSGKTSFINAFVNGIFPMRIIPTTDAQVYYRKVDIVDDNEVSNLRRPFIVEIEDTPGSEKGQEENAAGADGEHIAKGVRVNVLSDRKKVQAAFRASKILKYEHKVDAMLGHTYTVKHVGKGGVVGLLAHDGSIVDFPQDAVELKTSLELPVDKFLLTSTQKPKMQFKTLADRRRYGQDLQRPLAAYERPIGDAEMDKTLTRNRMGFFLCFDLSDESGDSLKEALQLHRMLQEAIEKRANKKVLPFIYLVACKTDKNHPSYVYDNNYQVAKNYSEDEEVPLYMTSAKTLSGVQEVFRDMVMLIGTRQSLWSLKTEDQDEDEAEEEGGTCFSQ